MKICLVGLSIVGGESSVFIQSYTNTIERKCKIFNQLQNIQLKGGKKRWF